LGDIGGWQAILGDDDDLHNSILIDSDNDRLIIEGNTDNDMRSWTTLQDPLVLNTWNHFAICLDTSGEGKAYQNGIELSSNDASALTAHLIFKYIGRGESNYLHGYLCNLAYWSGTLTQPQVKSIMNKNYEGLTTSEKTNLVSWWNLDTMIDDASTTQYHDTVIGAVYDNHNPDLGPNLFDNETFDDTSAVYNTTLASYEISGTGITINGTGTSGSLANQKILLGPFSVTSGAYYLISFDITATNNGGLAGIVVADGELKKNYDYNEDNNDDGADREHYHYPHSPYIGTHETIFIPNSSSITLNLHVGTAIGATTSFDNVKLRKLGGNAGVLR
jgi:hypothetical protein